MADQNLLAGAGGFAQGFASVLIPKIQQQQQQALEARQRQQRQSDLTQAYMNVYGSDSRLSDALATLTLSGATPSGSAIEGALRGEMIDEEIRRRFGGSSVAKNLEGLSYDQKAALLAQSSAIEIEDYKKRMFVTRNNELTQNGKKSLESLTPKERMEWMYNNLEGGIISRGAYDAEEVDRFVRTGVFPERSRSPQKDGSLPPTISSILEFAQDNKRDFLDLNDFTVERIQLMQFFGLKDVGDLENFLSAAPNMTKMIPQARSRMLERVNSYLTEFDRYTKTPQSIYTEWRTTPTDKLADFEKQYPGLARYFAQTTDGGEVLNFTPEALADEASRAWNEFDKARETYYQSTGSKPSSIAQKEQRDQALAHIFNWMAGMKERMRYNSYNDDALLNDIKISLSVDGEYAQMILQVFKSSFLNQQLNPQQIYDELEKAGNAEER